MCFICNVLIWILYLQIEILTPKQNGSIEKLDQDSKNSAATIKGMWKKAFKSLKSTSDTKLVSLSRSQTLGKCLQKPQKYLRLQVGKFARSQTLGKCLQKPQKYLRHQVGKFARSQTLGKCLQKPQKYLRLQVGKFARSQTLGKCLQKPQKYLGHQVGKFVTSKGM